MYGLYLDPYLIKILKQKAKRHKQIRKSVWIFDDIHDLLNLCIDNSITWVYTRTFLRL